MISKESVHVRTVVDRQPADPRLRLGLPFRCCAFPGGLAASSFGKCVVADDVGVRTGVIFCLWLGSSGAWLRLGLCLESV